MIFPRKNFKFNFASLKFRFLFVCITKLFVILFLFPDTILNKLPKKLAHTVGIDYGRREIKEATFASLSFSALFMTKG